MPSNPPLMSVLNRASAIAVSAAGELFATGSFGAFGSPQPNTLRWTGTNWTAVGLNSPTNANGIAALPNGDIVVTGGGFITPPIVGRWDGATWSTLPLPASSFIVVSPVVDNNGDLLILSLQQFGATEVLKWNGTSWTVVHTVNAIAGIKASPAGLLLYGGSGIQLDTVDLGVTGSVADCAVLSNGDVVICGDLTMAGSTPVSRVARWDGTSWHAIGQDLNTPISTVSTIRELPGGELFVGGSFPDVNGQPSRGLAHFDGTWKPLSSTGLNGEIRASAALPNGEAVVGGSFTSGEGQQFNHVAQRNNGRWRPIAQGFDGPVEALATNVTGEIYAGGSFGSAGGSPVSNIARFDGTSWQPLGTGTNGTVTSLSLAPNGDVVCSGAFTIAGGIAANGIARYDGASWSAIGGGLNGPARSLLVEATTIVATGDFTAAGGQPASNIASWDGTSWSGLGTGLNGSGYDVLRLPDGTIAACGAFANAGGTPANGVARWDGISWHAFGAGFSVLEPTTDLQVLPGGGLAASHRVPNSSGHRVSRWRAPQWLPLADFDDTATTMALLTSGNLFVGGSFATVDGNSSTNNVVLEQTCPAEISPIGNPCATGSPPQLSGVGAPWTGETVDLIGTNLPAQTIVVGIFGTSVTPLLLNTILPAPPGCLLLGSPDQLELLVSSPSGMASTQLSIPNTPSLGGLRVYHTMMPFVLDATGNIAAVELTNGLNVRIGYF